MNGLTRHHWVRPFLLLIVSLFALGLNAAEKPNCRTRKIRVPRRRALIGLQRWVNEGHQPWQLDASAVGEAYLRTIQSSYSVVRVERETSADAVLLLQGADE